MEAAKNLLFRLQGAAEGTVVGFDTEFGGPPLVGKKKGSEFVNVYRSYLLGFSVTIGNQSYYVPIRHSSGNLEYALCGDLLRLLHCGRFLLAAHHAPAEWFQLEKEQVSYQVKDYRDTCILMWCLGLSSRQGGYALKDLAEDYLLRDTIRYQDVLGKFKESRDCPPELLVDYACQDAELALELYQQYWPVISQDKKLLDSYLNIEMPHAEVLMRLRNHGLGVDRNAITELYNEGIEREKQILEEWSSLCTASISSPVQLANVLYADGVWDSEGLRVGKSGLATVNADALDLQLKRCKEGSLGRKLAELKLEYQELHKITSTYTVGLMENANQYPDLRLHSDFNHTGTGTGRLSSSYPNLQNLPVHGSLAPRVLDGFRARPGYIFISADYSQIELRVLSFLAEDPILKAAFLSGLDLHQQIADKLGIPRFEAKTLNFAVVYGAAAKKIAQMLGCTIQRAKKVLRDYDALLAGIPAYKQKAVLAASQRGYIKTLVGRRRYIPQLASEDRVTRWSGERLAGNTPVQGGARDIMAIGMNRVYKKFGDVLCNTIHDEVKLEVPIDGHQDVVTELREILEGAWDIGVPLKVDVSTGFTFKELKQSH